MSKQGLVRVRFETKVIAPATLPDFVYRASVIGHSTIQYTAVADADPKQFLSAIRQAWPDAVIHVLDTKSGGFIDSDNHLSAKDFGTASTPERQPSPWSRVFGNKNADLAQFSAA